MKKACIFIALLMCLLSTACQSNAEIKQSTTVDTTSTTTADTADAITTTQPTTSAPDATAVDINIAPAPQTDEPTSADPVPYAQEGNYLLVENGTHFHFSAGVGWTMDEPRLGVSVLSHDATLWNAMIYSAPVIERQLTDGSWERLPYRSDSAMATDAQWVSMPFFEDPWLINFSELDAEPTIGMYRIVLFVCAQDTNGDWHNLRYEFPVDVYTLTNPMVTMETPEPIS